MFDKKKVKIGKKVKSEPGWKFVMYNGESVGQITIDKTYSYLISHFLDPQQLCQIEEATTKQEMAENLCKNVLEQIEFKIKYWQNVHNLLNKEVEI